MKSTQCGAMKRLVKFVTVCFKSFGVTAPVFVHFDKDFQIDFFVEEFFQCLACFGRHFFQCNPLVSNDNTLLAIAFHIDYGIDVDMVCRFLELFHHHFDSIRNFLVVIQQNFSRIISVTKNLAGLSVHWSLPK